MPPTDLVAGPYRPPACRAGDWLDDEIDGRVEVGGWTAAPISWPRRKKTGRASLILTDELARAVRTESVAAICHWWGVGTTKVWMWRKALGVDTTDGSQRIARRGVPPDAAARGRMRAAEPDARARMAESKRGRPVLPERRRQLVRQAQRPRSAMAPDELLQWRYRMEYSLADASEALGIGTTTLTRYLSGTDPIPHRVSLACAALYAGLPPVSLSIRAWCDALGRPTKWWLATPLGLANNTVIIAAKSVCQIERGGGPKRVYRLAMAAIEHGLLPWHRLYRRGLTPVTATRAGTGSRRDGPVTPCGRRPKARRHLQQALRPRPGRRKPTKNSL